jgi:transcriptional regulator with XRE-family HTH domain
MTTDENRLGEFLRARRELVDPRDFGLHDHGRRRAPGMRRDEVAQLAGVSSHYYARLEQGRDRHPSAPVLDALARVLRLDDEALDQLRRLASPPLPARRRRARRPERVHPQLIQLMTQWSAQAAVVVGRHRDVLAANDLAILLNPGFSPGRNLLRDLFLEPAAKETYPDWDGSAEDAVAGLRAGMGTEVNDPHLTDLVGELSLSSQDFRRLWARHDLKERSTGTKQYTNPFVGTITLQYLSFRINGADGQTLFVYFAEPGSPDEQSLTLLSTIGTPPPHDRARFRRE